MVYENKEKEAIKTFTSKLAHDIATLEKNGNILVLNIGYDVRENRRVKVSAEIGPFVPLNPGPLRFHVRYLIPEV